MTALPRGRGMTALTRGQGLLDKVSLTQNAHKTEIVLLCNILS